MEPALYKFIIIIIIIIIITVADDFSLVIDLMLRLRTSRMS